MWPRLKYVSVLFIFHFEYDDVNKIICGHDEIISNNMILQKSLKPVTETSNCH